jgi:hypothetical protein
MKNVLKGYVVISHGGYIGSAGTVEVEVYSTRDAAKIKAKGLNGCLSAGEKKYYGMKYTVKAV